MDQRPDTSSADTGIRNWTLETDDRDIAWLGLRCSGSTNVLSERVIRELGQVLDAIEIAPPAALVIFSHKNGNFIAGADIKEFPSLSSEELAREKVLAGHRILQRLEDLRLPTLAVLNGITLGGGLELALACSRRMAYPSERRVIGLPEVQLGVHPGLGGTVRLPRLIGIRRALPMMLTGKSLTPVEALRAGLIDRICEDPADWRDQAAKLVLGAAPRSKPGLIDRLLAWPVVRTLLARSARTQTRRRANPKHYPAPYAIIDLWRAHGGSDAGYAAEAASFARLAMTPTSRNLVRVFLLQDQLKSLGKGDAAECRHAHIVGAGTMGADIAAWCALRGMTVTLQDRERQYVDAGMERARKGLQRKLRDDDLVTATMQRLVGDTTGEGAESADVVIEAIFENTEAKQAIFRDLEKRASADAILATNTSSIPLDQIATVMRQPDRLVGIHFFNPVARMPLVEVVHSDATDDTVLHRATAFVRQIGKLPLPCRATPGFLVNRILAPYMDEAARLHDEGYAIELIDQAAVDFGMPVGPLELADTVGLDILQHVGEMVGPVIRRELPNSIAQRVAAGKLGQKTGEGYYRWQDGKPVRNARQRRPIPDDISDRLMLSLVNEAAACLADEVVSTPELVDAGTVFGTGFAPFRGGPLEYAHSRGESEVVRTLQTLEQKYGQRFKPSGGWTILTARGKPQAGGK